MTDFVTIVAEGPFLAEDFAFEVFTQDRWHLNVDLWQFEAFDDFIEVCVLQRRHLGGFVVYCSQLELPNYD